LQTLYNTVGFSAQQAVADVRKLKFKNQILRRMAEV
jgi:hypothetical protein